MDKPLEITFRNLDRSLSIAALIEDKCGQLEQFYRHMIGMHVTVESPHKHQRKGRGYSVTIETYVPGKRLVTSHSPGREIRHTELIPTINDAFRAMSRQLEDYSRQQRGDTKYHETPIQGRVVKLFPEKGFGFILLTDGQEVYFHKNSVARKAFDNLELDAPVRVVLDEGESPNGPQASTVEPIGDMKLVDKRRVSAG